MTRIITRREAGLALPIPSRLQRRDGRDVLGITFHVTVTGWDDPTRKWREIQGAAMGGALPSGDVYGDIPYHDGISLAGDILQGRAHVYVGAHAKSTGNLANVATDGVAVIGDGKWLTEPAKNAIRAYVYLWTLERGRRPLLFDHNDWRALGGIATACPGKAVEGFIAQLRREARSGA